MGARYRNILNPILLQKQTYQYCATEVTPSSEFSTLLHYRLQLEGDKGLNLRTECKRRRKEKKILGLKADSRVSRNII